MNFALKVVLAWRLGSLVGSLILGRLRGAPPGWLPVACAAATARMRAGTEPRRRSR